jgi:hypothetical protein
MLTAVFIFFCLVAWLLLGDVRPYADCWMDDDIEDEE